MKNTVIMICCMLITGCGSFTPAITDDRGRTVPDSIAIAEKFQIGGIPQWMLIRGRSTDNPILLFLHGGPGTGEAPLMRHYNAVLEDHFIVVNWDQRGAGKSYSRSIPLETMTIAQFVSDAHEVVMLVRERFHKEKIFVMGHSWGTILGVFLVQKYPDLFYAYIGIGQISCCEESERRSFHYTLQAAEKAGDKQAVRELKAMNDPHPFESLQGDWFDRLRRQREWLLKLGGSLYGRTNYDRETAIYLHSQEYTLNDVIRWIQGQYFSVKAIWPELIRVNLPAQVPELKTPVYFMLGRHDYQVNYELAEEYFNQLKAPEKKLYWFEQSCHSPIFEEADKFNRILIEEILPLYVVR